MWQNWRRWLRPQATYRTQAMRWSSWDHGNHCQDKVLVFKNHDVGYGFVFWFWMLFGLGMADFVSLLWQWIANWPGRFDSCDLWQRETIGNRDCHIGLCTYVRNRFGFPKLHNFTQWKSLSMAGFTKSQPPVEIRSIFYWVLKSLYRL